MATALEQARVVQQELRDEHRDSPTVSGVLVIRNTKTGELRVQLSGTVQPTDMPQSIDGICLVWLGVGTITIPGDPRNDYEVVPDETAESEDAAASRMALAEQGLWVPGWSDRYLDAARTYVQSVAVPEDDPKTLRRLMLAYCEALSKGSGGRF